MTLAISVTGFWSWLAPFGNSAILLPVAALIAAVLLAQRSTRRAGLWWLVVAMGYSLLVATTKWVYMAWGWHVPHLDFIGLSGDSATAFLFWPVAGAYVAARGGTRWKAVAVGAGGVLATLVAISRVETWAHSVAEAVAGSVCGAIAAAVFLWAVRHDRPVVPTHLAWLPVVVLIAALLFTVDRPRPVDINGILAWMARTVSGHRSIYTRCDLGRWAALNPAAPVCRPTGPETRRRARG